MDEQNTIEVSEALLDRIARGETTTLDGEPITRDLLIEDFASKRGEIGYKLSEILLQKSLSDPGIAGYCKEVLGVDAEKTLGEDGILSPEEAMGMLISQSTHLAVTGAVSPPSEETLIRLSTELKGFSKTEIDGLAICAQNGFKKIIQATEKSAMEYIREKLEERLQGEPEEEPSRSPSGKYIGEGIFDTTPRDGMVPDPDPEMEINPQNTINGSDGLMNVRQDFNTVAPVPGTLMACAVEGFGGEPATDQPHDTHPQERADLTTIDVKIT